MSGIGIGIGMIFSRLRNSAASNTIDESLLADQIYLVTEEGYLIVDEDNFERILISEDNL